MENTTEKFSYSEVFEYIKFGRYPPESTSKYKRSLRRKANNFRVHEGRLYYIGNQETRKQKSAKSVQRLVIETEEEQQRLISAVHEDGHLGML